MRLAMRDLLQTRRTHTCQRAKILDHSVTHSFKLKSNEYARIRMVIMKFVYHSEISIIYCRRTRAEHNLLFRPASVFFLRSF